MLTEIVVPTQCPDCDQPTQVLTEPTSQVTTVWCVNDYCPGRLRDMLTFIADRKLLEIEGLGPEMAAALIAKQYVLNIADLFEFCDLCSANLVRLGEDKFNRNMRAQGLSTPAVLKMIETTERAKTLGWDRWIAALGIPMIGLTLGKVIARTLRLDSHDMRFLPGKLYIHDSPSQPVIEGIGFHKRAEINHYAADPAFSDLTSRLYAAGIRPKAIAQAAVVEGAPLAGMAFMVTGEMYGIGSREFIQKEFVRLGATLKSGVTKKVTHLFVGSEAGQSKLKKASELGIKTYDEDWVRETLEANGVKLTASSLVAEFL